MCLLTDASLLGCRVWETIRRSEAIKIGSRDQCSIDFASIKAKTVKNEGCSRGLGKEEYYAYVIAKSAFIFSIESSRSCAFSSANTSAIGHA